MRVTDVVAIGWRAAALLATSGEAARVLAPLTASTYVTVAGEIAWLGTADAPLHPRAILCATPAPAGLATGAALEIAPGALEPWRRETRLGPGAAPALGCGARRLAREAAALGPARGFGARLVGAPLAFPLDGAGPAADVLARACAAADAAAAARAARSLLGLGGGLTPSGDDYVGGAFFVRALLAPAGEAGKGWRAAGGAVRAAAAEHTHPVSAALLADLTRGEGWAPLHDLVAALARGADADARAAAGRLTALGHSSGWDLLAGVLAGAGA